MVLQKDVTDDGDDDDDDDRGNVVYKNNGSADNDSDKSDDANNENNSEYQGNMTMKKKIMIYRTLRKSLWGYIFFTDRCLGFSKDRNEWNYYFLDEKNNLLKSLSLNERMRWWLPQVIYYNMHVCPQEQLTQSETFESYVWTCSWSHVKFTFWYLKILPRRSMTI